MTRLFNGSKTSKAAENNVWELTDFSHAGLHSGIPQGSILGPIILFLIIDDWPEFLESITSYILMLTMLSFTIQYI